MQKLLKYQLLSFITILIVGGISYAQNIQFTASTNRTAVNTGDRFQIEFKANADIENFTPPKNLSDFRVLSGPNQSSSMSWINGKTSSSISYSYILMAVKEGKFTLQPANASYNGKTYTTNSLTIKVGKGVQVQSSKSGSNATKGKAINVSDDIFIKAAVNKSKVYQGEQIIATYKVYTKLSIAGAEPGDDVKLNGFWKQDIDLGQITWKDEVIGGYRWKVATIRKYVLFPQRSGNLEIDPLQMKFIAQKRVRSRGQGFFDQFFSQVENVEYNCKSKPIRIKVSPHPAPVPQDFYGAVGNLNMTVDVSSDQVKANEAINIKVKVAGKGNIGLIDPIAIDFPSDFEIYDPKINDNLKTTSNGVSGAREFDYLVIPRHAGKFDLGSITFSYFDPSAKKFKTITSQPIKIDVLHSDGSSNDNVTYSPSKEDIKILGEDIRFIHTSNLKIVRSDNSFYGSVTFYLLLLLAPILFFLVYIFRNKIRKANSDVVNTKKRKASKIAHKFLKSAQQSLASNNKNAFYEDISKALFGYISDKLNIPISALNQNNIKEKLNAIHISEATTGSLIETIDLCDMARFAPVALSEQEIYEKAETIINRIEEEV